MLIRISDGGGGRKRGDGIHGAPPELGPGLVVRFYKHCAPLEPHEGGSGSRLKRLNLADRARESHQLKFVVNERGTERMKPGQGPAMEFMPLLRSLGWGLDVRFYKHGAPLELHEVGSGNRLKRLNSPDGARESHQLKLVVNERGNHDPGEGLGHAFSRVCGFALTGLGSGVGRDTQAFSLGYDMMGFQPGGRASASGSKFVPGRENLALRAEGPQCIGPG